MKQIFYFVLGVVILIILSIPVSKKFQKQNELGDEISVLQTEIKKLENKNSDLNQMIAYLESEEFVELEARQKLNYQKEGEEVVIIKNQDNQDAVVHSEATNSKINSTKPQKWLKYFFN